MKKFILTLAISALAVVILSKVAFAGPPFNNLEGVGGVAFNPLAYLAEGDSDFKIGKQDIIGKPRFGAWYVNLPDRKIDWTAIGIADTLFKRLEVSYGFESVAISNGATYRKNNLGAKFLVLPENSLDSKLVPAFSIGTIFKTTNKNVTAYRKSGFDWYGVLTKTITQLPVPVIVSAGALSSAEYVTGVFGFNNKRKITSFANVDVVLPYNFVVGGEFKQGESFAAFKNANYWDAHLAWLANKNLTLIAAYTYTGNTKEARFGLGDGFVISAQYAF